MRSKLNLSSPANGGANSEKVYSNSSDPDEGHDTDFPPPTEKPDVLEEDMANPQPDRPTDLDSAPNGKPVQTTYNSDLVCDDSVFTLMKILHNISINTALKF